MDLHSWFVFNALRSMSCEVDRPSATAITAETMTTEKAQMWARALRERDAYEVPPMIVQYAARGPEERRELRALWGRMRRLIPDKPSATPSALQDRIETVNARLSERVHRVGWSALVVQGDGESDERSRSGVVAAMASDVLVASPPCVDFSCRVSPRTHHFGRGFAPSLDLVRSHAARDEASGERESAPDDAEPLRADRGASPDALGKLVMDWLADDRWRSALQKRIGALSLELRVGQCVLYEAQEYGYVRRWDELPCGDGAPETKTSAEAKPSAEREPVWKAADFDVLFEGKRRLTRGGNIPDRVRDWAVRSFDHLIKDEKLDPGEAKEKILKLALENDFSFSKRTLERWIKADRTS